MWFSGNNIRKYPVFENQKLLWDVIKENKDRYLSVMKKFGYSEEEAWSKIIKEYDEIKKTGEDGLYYLLYMVNKNLDLSEEDVRIENKYEEVVYSSPIWINLGFAGSYRRLRNTCDINEDGFLRGRIDLMVTPIRYSDYAMGVYNMLLKAENGEELIRKVDKDDEIHSIKREDVREEFVINYVILWVLFYMRTDLCISKRDEFLSY